MVERDLAHPLKKDPTLKALKLNLQKFTKKLEKNKTSYDLLPKESKVIFLAGVFDGEGSFGVWSRGQNLPKRLEVKVETTDADMVARFHAMYGGLFYATTPKNENHKHLFRWKVTGQRAWQVLKEMIPYMCQRRREKFENL